MLNAPIEELMAMSDEFDKLIIAEKKQGLGIAPRFEDD